MPKDDKDEATVDMESVTKAAERLGLKGKDRAEYIHKHMTGFGYKSKRTYFRDEENEKRGGGFFRSSRDDDDDDDDDY
jgi:hypothetical protein